MLTILLFGSPQLVLDGRPLGVTRRKSRALLYYLAAHTAPITRDQVLGLLWPDHDRPSAQQILRTTLHGLRKALGQEFQATDDALALAPDVQVDVRRFVAYLSPPTPNLGLLETALDLYRGDFLQDFALPDGPDFDAWVDGERERYRQMAARGFAALAQRYAERQEFPAALDAISRALAFDPLQEDLQRTAMRLHYLAGDRAGAIRRYEGLRRLLDDELGVPPLAETRGLYDAIITDTLEPDTMTRWQDDKVIAQAPLDPFTPSPPHLVALSQTLPFIGRAAEIQALRSATAAHKLALIEGEPGIGKTRLAQAFTGDSDTLNLVGVAHELEQSLPYQPIIDALRGLLSHPAWPALRASLQLPAVWLAETARLLPELAPTGGRGKDESTALLLLPAADELRLWEGASQFLLAIARQRPITLFLDDLHWADASTLALIGYLIRQAAVAPIFFLATTRPFDPRSPLAALVQALTREGRLQRLALARLSAAEMTALARQLSPSYSYPLADWLTQTSEGNPYIVAELVRHAREHALLLPNGTLNLTGLSSTPIVPQTVYSLIQSRLARLSDAARRVLDLAVAVGREFDVDIVARAAALSEHAALDALAELQAVGLIAPLDGLRYAFDHSLTMEVAYRELGEPQHRLLHRHVAEALEQIYHQRLDAVAGLLASHFAEGHVPERAAPYAFRAGQQAAGLAAWTEAIAFYEQALAVADDGRRLEVLMVLGDACIQASEAARGSEAFRAAISLARERGDAATAARAQLELVITLLPQARFAEAIELVRQVRDAGRPEDVLLAEICWGTILSIEGADLAGAAEHLQTAAELCAARSTPGVRDQIIFALGSVRAQQGDLAGAVARYREALALAEQIDASWHIRLRILAHNNLAYHLLLLGEPGADEHARIGLSLAQEKGVLDFQPFLLSTMGEIALAQDDLDGAERSLAEGLSLAERLSLPERIAGLTANLGLVAARRGQAALAVQRLSSARARADALGIPHLAAQIRLWLVPLLPPAEARATLAEARAIAESGGRRRLLDEVARLERDGAGSASHDLVQPLNDIV